MYCGVCGAMTKIVAHIFDAIVSLLVEEGRVELRNFGVFEVKHRQARTARDLCTGEMVLVPPRCVVTFTPGREMKDRIAAEGRAET
jgi:integration host factor subunit beta